MGLTSHTGLLASVTTKNAITTPKSPSVELRCDVTPAPFMLRPYAGLYNPFPLACSVLCNHPAEAHARDFVRQAKDAWALEGRTHNFQEELSKFQDGAEKEKIRTPHDIVTEDMFRRYTETDSRPLTPAPTLASGKSRGSRRCMTPDQSHQRTAIVLDLRRSHSQVNVIGNSFGSRPSAKPVQLSPKSKLTISVIQTLPLHPEGHAITDKSETLYYHGYSTSEVTQAGYTSCATTNERGTTASLDHGDVNRTAASRRCEQLPPLACPLVLSERTTVPNTNRKSQLKALNLGKTIKTKAKQETPAASQRSKTEKDADDALDSAQTIDEGEIRRRGKRRRKGRMGSDRLTSAGLAAQAQQDPETQIAGIGTDSHNASSRGSVSKPAIEDDDIFVQPPIKAGASRKTDSFLDDDMLKYLHREVDEEAIETEFDTKRRYVLEEAMRTRPERPYGQEMQNLLRELKVPSMSLGDWLHIPRVFSRRNAQFTLPIDTCALETLTPMQYASRFVTLTKSKQLLYLTVLRKFRPGGYRMPIQNIEEGLILMMGGILKQEQVEKFKSTMEWENYIEEESAPDDIKVTIIDSGHRKVNEKGDAAESTENTLKYRTWCGLCAVCERMCGRFPPKDKDPADGMELSDFTMIETKLASLRVHSGLVEVLNTIRLR